MTTNSWKRGSERKLSIKNELKVVNQVIILVVYYPSQLTRETHPIPMRGADYTHQHYRKRSITEFDMYKENWSVFSKTGQIEHGIVQNGPLILVNLNGYVDQPKDNSQDKNKRQKDKDKKQRQWQRQRKMKDSKWCLTVSSSSSTSTGMSVSLGTNLRGRIYRFHSVSF